MKKIIGCFMVALIVVGLVGCGNNSKDQAQNGKTTIIFWHAMGGPIGRTLEEMVKKFNATHKDIYVKLENMGNYNSLQMKLVAAIQANVTPDIAQVYESWVANMIKGKRIIPLDDFVKEPGFNLNDIHPVFINDVKMNGKIWAMPFNKSMPVLYWNKELFKKVGLDPNKPPANWEEFLEYAKKLTIDTNGDGKPDIYGTAFPPSSWYFGCMVYQNGGKLLDEKKRKAAFNEEPGVKALQYWIDLIFKYKVAYLTTGFNHQTDFQAGKVAMIWGSSVSKIFMEKQINFDFGIAPFPQGEKKASILSGTNVVIFDKKDPKRAKAAWEFIKWFISTKNTAYWAVKTAYMPVRKSALQTDIMKNLFKKQPMMKAAIMQLDYAAFEPFDTAWFRGRKYLDEAISDALVKGGDAKQYLDEAAKKVNEEFKQEEKER